MTTAEELKIKVEALVKSDEKIADLEGKIKQFETEQEEFKSKLGVLETENAKLVTAKEKLESDLSASGAKCTELEEAKTGLETEKESLEGKLKLSPGHADLAPGADKDELEDGMNAGEEDSILTQYMAMPASIEKSAFYFENMAVIDKAVDVAFKATASAKK